MIYTLSIGLSIVLLLFCLWIRFSRKDAIAFLHPYCEMGGGGEVVLWKAVQALCERIKGNRHNCSIYIYTTTMDNTTLRRVKDNIRDRFAFDLDAIENANLVKFVHIRSRTLLDPKWYPRFTLFGQFLGGLIVSLECLIRLNPALLVESTGIPGALPVFRLIGGSNVLVYMHYPTITTNMTQRVYYREHMYNNSGFIARSAVLSSLKYNYYVLFAALYRLCGICASKVMVNGNFTKRHIEKLWPTVEIRLCYPPVALDNFNSFNSNAESLLESKGIVNILSLGQFRPEKNHKSQLETLKCLKERGGFKFCLIMVGGVRNKDDERVVDDIRKCATELDLIEGVDFKFVCNAPLENILDLMKQSMFGIHTMIDEHFGIAVVEMMSAGVIVVAHESGGPLLDIVGSDTTLTGFLGKHASQYASFIHDALQRSRKRREAIRLAASKKAMEFSEERFKKTISDEIINLSIQ